MGEAVSAAVFEVELRGSDGNGARFCCAADMTIEAAARRAGIRLRAACYQGGCGACRAQLIDGSVMNLGPVSAARTNPATGACFVLLCRAAPVTDVVLQPVAAWQTFNPKAFSARNNP